MKEGATPQIAIISFSKDRGSDLNQNKANLKTARVIPKNEKYLYFIPKLSTDDIRNSSNICSFIGVTKKTYNKLGTSQQGVDIANFNIYVLDASTVSHTLLDVDKVKYFK